MKKAEKLSQDQINGFQQMNQENERVSKDVEALRKTLNEKVIVETEVTEAGPTGVEKFFKKIGSILEI